MPCIILRTNVVNPMVSTFKDKNQVQQTRTFKGMDISPFTGMWPRMLEAFAAAFGLDRVTYRTGLINMQAVGSGGDKRVNTVTMGAQQVFNETPTDSASAGQSKSYLYRR